MDSRLSATALLWIIGRADPHSLLEIRHRRGGAMRQRFIPAHLMSAALAFMATQAKASDVFIGAAPRRERRGGKESIERAWTLWADCDSAESSALLTDFEPAPRYVVASGGNDRLQAWWPLKQWVTPETAERLNRRLAFALKADIKCADVSRILRPPGTLNHKYKPPRRVVCQASVPGFIDPSELEALPSLDERAKTILAPRVYDRDDPLMSIAPPVYVQALTGRIPDHTGKIKCPFHGGGEERTPSFHVYATADKGWHCFGCSAGGTIFDLASLLWNIDPRGKGFVELQKRLGQRLGQ